MLNRWLLQQPGHSLAIAAAHLALWAVCRATVLRNAPKANVLWIPAVLWIAYAAWEWLVLKKTPEADIRVDSTKHQSQAVLRQEWNPRWSYLVRSSACWGDAVAHIAHVLALLPSRTRVRVLRWNRRATSA
jgi:hypothetical protein